MRKYRYRLAWILIVPVVLQTPAPKVVLGTQPCLDQEQLLYRNDEAVLAYEPPRLLCQIGIPPT